ncbi:MAG: TIGR00730 family Rossman fold protein [Alphaproteobacteria bacterium]|nr:TIGR00730 family Rossman fold protein [Alphaproteobacteria bacterium]
MNLCVYCGSANRIAEKYKLGVADVGKLLAEQNIRVIYGGARTGLMGILADSVLEAGGKVMGIIPQAVAEHEMQHTGLTELEVVDTLHTRKQAMFDRSDAFLILPGGLGTLDELFEIMTWKQLGMHNKHIIIYNMHGFWKPLQAMVDHIVAHNFAPVSHRTLYCMVSSMGELLTELGRDRDPFLDPNKKWL